MNVYGSKRAHHTFAKGRRMIIRYLVCDTPYPVVSIAGLCRYGRSFDHRRTTLLWRGHRRADATTTHRLYNLGAKSRSRPKGGTGD